MKKFKKKILYTGVVVLDEDFGGCLSLREIRTNLTLRESWFREAEKLGALSELEDGGFFILSGNNPALKKLGFGKARSEVDLDIIRAKCSVWELRNK